MNRACFTQNTKLHESASWRTSCLPSAHASIQPMKNYFAQMKNRKYTIGGIISLTIVLLSSCATKQATTLKDAYKNDFFIGAAISSSLIMGKDTNSSKLLFQHFNSITAENAMKWERIHPEPAVYNFDTSDMFVAIGQKNNMFIVGHCLLWHQQTPDWVFTDSLGKDLNREALLKRLRDHITTIATRYKGKINGYDVVNEALNEDGTMRKSKWYEIIGEDYIQKAFEFVKAADPSAELYYNDYNIENPAKREGAIRIIKNLQAKGIKVDGVGIQGHWILNSVQFSNIDSSLSQFGRLGVKIHITELDMNVLPLPDNFSGAEITDNFELQVKLNPYANGLPDSIQLRFTNQFVELFKIFRKHKDILKRVTFWGITDKTSWLNDWPVKGRTNYPLLFDRNYKAKPLVEELIKL
jgi:endo-1,4-beta-xylanase